MVYTIMSTGQDARRVLSDHAERIARGISSTSRGDRDRALTWLSSGIFADDPQRAERIALSIEDPAVRTIQLISLGAMHKAEPERI